MTTDYFLSIPEEDQESQGFANIRFGNMKLADGSEALGAIAKDLDGLPKADQHHWAAHEIQNPRLDENDKAWTEYIDEQFYASWRADHTDYIKLGRYGIIGTFTGCPDRSMTTRVWCCALVLSIRSSPKCVICPQADVRQDAQETSSNVAFEPACPLHLFEPP